MRVYIHDDPGEAKDDAARWVSGQLDGFPAGELSTGRETYLYRGGPEAFEKARLDPEYSLVQRLFADGQLVGYVTCRLNQPPARQIAEVLVLQRFCGPETCVSVLLGSEGAGDGHHDALSGCIWPDRFGAVAHRVPLRVFPSLSAQDAVHIIHSKTADRAVQFLGSIGASISDDLRQVLCERWGEGRNRQRLVDIIALYSVTHYSLFGSPRLHADSATWPFDDPVFPGLLDDQADYEVGSEFHQMSMVNLLRHVAFGAKLIRVDAAQERALEERLLNLGQAMTTWPGHADPASWVGRLQDGRELFCTGSIVVGDCRIYTVHVKDGLRLGQAAYRDHRFRHYIGDVAAQLWKANDHAHFLVPEEQRGVGLIVGQ